VNIHEECFGSKLKRNDFLFFQGGEREIERECPCVWVWRMGIKSEGEGKEEKREEKSNYFYDL